MYNLANIDCFGAAAHFLKPFLVNKKSAPRNSILSIEHAFLFLEVIQPLHHTTVHD
jgi:hypothetical protein